MPGPVTSQTAPQTAPRRRGIALARDVATDISRDIAVVAHSVAHGVDPAARRARNRHGGGVIWLTGLSGAGKSTLAMALERRLFEAGFQVYALDGDNMRGGLSADLGFAPDDRAENIRRIGEVAALMADAGLIAIAAFISPYRADRARARARACTDGAAGGAPGSTPGGAFVEVHVRADLATCEARDPKGLYARAGEIADFTGVSAPYEAPEAPELVVDTAAEDVETCVAQLFECVTARFGREG